MANSLEVYKNILRKLLPRGKAWQSNKNDFTNLIDGLCPEFKRFNDRAENLINEIDLYKTVELLEDFEKELGITPDKDSTIIERRNNVISRINTTGGQSKDYIISVINKLGFLAKIEEFEPFQAGSAAGEILTNSDWLFAFRITTEEIKLSVKIFLIDIINKIKPAHTIAMFDYKMAYFEAGDVVGTVLRELE
jgi:uncharacterized protein YmfQ (DUF2313 family)